MNEMKKVKIGGSTLQFSPNACDELSRYIGVLERCYDVEVMADIEARIVELIMEKQSTEEVVEKPLVESIISTIGYPEGYADEPKNGPQKQTTQTNLNQGPLHSLGRVVVFCMKAFVVLFLAGWILCGLGIIVGIITLVATDAALVSGIEYVGVSPIGFAALVCGSIVVFMAVVAYLLICLLGHKKVNGRTMIFAGILWLLLTVWAWIGLGKNILYWDSWGEAVEMNIENWAEEVEEWAEEFEYNLDQEMEALEDEMDRLEDNLENRLESLNGNAAGVVSKEPYHMSITLDGTNSLVSLALLDCLSEVIDEIDDWDDEIKGALLRKQNVTIELYNVILPDGRASRDVEMKVGDKIIKTSNHTTKIIYINND